MVIRLRQHLKTKVAYNKTLVCFCKVASASNACNVNNNGNANNNTASNANYVAAINTDKPTCRCGNYSDDKERQTIRKIGGKYIG